MMLLAQPYPHTMLMEVLGDGKPTYNMSAVDADMGLLQTMHRRGSRWSRMWPGAFSALDLHTTVIHLSLDGSLCMQEADGIFRALLGVTGKADAAVAVGLAKSTRWRKVGPLVKSYWGNSLALLGSVTEAQLLSFTLRRLRASVAMLAPFDRIRDKFVKSCLNVFGEFGFGASVNDVDQRPAQPRL